MSNPRSKTQRKGGSHVQDGESFTFPVADGSVKLAGRDQAIRESTSIQDRPLRRDEHNGVLQGESDGSQPSDQQTDDTEAQDDFWSIYRHHVQPSVLEEGHSQYHSSLLTLPGGRTQHWMYRWFMDVTVNSAEALIVAALSSLFQWPSKLTSLLSRSVVFWRRCHAVSDRVFAVGCGFDGSTNCCGRPKRF